MAVITLKFVGDAKGVAQAVSGELKEVRAELKAMDGSVSSYAKAWRQAQGVAKVAAAAIAASSVAVSAAIVYQTKQAIDQADRMDELAGRTGIATEKLSEYAYAAKLTGTDLETVNTGLLRFTKNVAESANPLSKQAELFKAIGVQTVGADGNLRSIDSTLADVMDRFKALPEGPEKAAAALELFGRGGQEMIDFLSIGSDGLAKFGQEAREAGQIISGETAAQAALLNDNLDRLKMTVNSVGLSVATELLPQMSDLSKQINSPEFREGFQTIVQGAMTGAVKVAELVGELANLTKFVGEEIAARAAGPASDDIVRLEQAVDRQQRLMDQLDQKGSLGFQMPNSSSYANEQRAELIRMKAALLEAKQVEEALAIARHKSAESAAAEAADINNLNVETKRNADGHREAVGALAEYFRGTEAAAAAQREKEKADREAAIAIREQVKAIEAQAVAMGTLDAIIDDYGAGSAPMREALEANRREFAELDKAIGVLNEQGPVTEDIQLKIAAAYDAVSAAAAGRVAQAKKEEDVIGVLNAGYAEDIRLAGLSTEARQVEMSVAQAMALARRTHSEEWAAQHADEIRRTVESGEAQLLLAEQAAAAAEEFRAVWQRGVDSVAVAIGDFVAGGMKDFDSLSDAVKQTFRAMIADLVSQLARSGLQRMIAGLFGGASGGGGGGNWLSMLGNMFGGGGGGGGFNLMSLFGGGGAAGGGGGFNLSSLFGNGTGSGGIMQSLGGMLGLTGAAGAGNASAMASYGVLNTSTGTAAGLMNTGGGAAMQAFARALPIIGWIYAGMQFNEGMYQRGWKPHGGSLTLPNGQDVSGGGSSLARFFEGPTGTLSALVGQRFASMLIGSAPIARLFGRKAPELRGSETEFDFSGDTIGGGERFTTVERGGFFRSDRWRDHSFELSDDMRTAGQEVFDALRETMLGAAESLAADAPDRLAASLRIVQEFDKKGVNTATKYLVEMFGRTWEESTQEAAMTRLHAEAIIASIDFALYGASAAIGESVADTVIGGIDGAGPGLRDRIGDVMAKVLGEGGTRGWGDETSDFPGATGEVTSIAGEASRIAERWREDPEQLAAGAQFLLLAATDIRAGVGLLRGEGGLTAVTDLVEDLAVSGESLVQTYARLGTGAGLFDQVLELSGITLDRSRESFVRWTAGVAEQAGGLDRLSALINDYTTRYFTAAERAQYIANQAMTAGRTEFEQVGLNIDDFTGEGGMQALRALFEQAMPTLSEEATVQWLEALAALGLVIDASQNLANTGGQTAEQLAAINEILESNAWDLAAAGMTTAERAIAEINRAYDQQRTQLEGTAATVDQLNDLEAQRTQALEQQQAAMQAQIEDLLGGNAFALAAAGMTSAERAAADINRTYDEQRRQLIDLGATSAQLLQLDLQRATALDQQTAAMQANINALLADLAFDLNIDGLSERELAEARVNAQFDRYREQLIDQGATVEQLTRLEDLRTEALEQATTAMRENVVYARDAADSLSLFAEAMKRIRDEFTGDGMRAMVEGLTGFSPTADTAIVRRDDVLAELGQTYAGQIADLSTQLAVAQQQLGSTPWYNFYDKALLEGKIRMLRETLAQVGDGLEDALDYANELFAQQLGGLLEGLRQEFGANDPVADINARFDTLREQAEAWGATNEELAEIEGYRQQALLNLIDDRYESEMNWIRQLMDFRDSLLLDDTLSTLTPAQKMEEARRQYEATLAAARAGDVTAQGNFQNMAQAYLEQARSFYGSDQYTPIFQEVLDHIQSLIDGAGVTVAGDAAGQETAAAGEAPEPASRTITIDLAPVTAELVGLRRDLNDGVDSLVAEVRDVGEKVVALTSATTQQTAAIETGNNILRNR